jgi:trimeric autotransporter adhesin
LVGLRVSQEGASMGLAGRKQFTAHGTYSDGTEEDVTAQVSWSSSAPAVVQISNEPGSEGLATAVGAGTAEIEAALAGMVRTTSVLVTA